MSYYGYGYEGSAFFGALILVSFIASIVLTVMGYKRYVHDGSSLRFKPQDKATWGPFLRFDTLIIDKVMKALYLFLAIFIALAFASGVIASLFDGIGTFLAALIAGAIFLVVVELLLRVSYELIILTVVIARNTSEIKRAVCGGEAADADGISSPNPSAPAHPFQAEPAVPAAYTTYTAVPAPQPAPTPVPDQPAAQPAPQQPAVCPACGTVVAPGSKFCGVCGHQLP